MFQFLGLLLGVAALCGAFYVLWRPHWTFVLVIAMFPVEQLLQVYVPFFGAHNMVINLGICSLALVAVVMRTFRKEPMTSGYLNAATLLTLALYGLWALGILYTSAKAAATRDINTTIAYQVLLLGLLPMLVLDIFEYRKMLTGMMVLGTIIAGLIILNPHSVYYSGRLQLDLGMVGGIHASGNPLATAEMGAFIALIAALIRPERNTQLFTLLRIVTFIGGMGLAIGSGSRGQVLAVAVTGILFYPVSRKLANPKQFFLTAIGFMVLVGGLYLVFKLFIGAQNQERWSAQGMVQDVSLRFEMAESLLHAYINSPSHWLLGLGTNAYATISPDQAIYVHNVAAEVLGEHGIVGATLFVLIMYLTVKYSRKLWSIYKDDPSMRSTVAILMASCVYALFLALKQGNMAYPAPFFTWLILTKLAKHEEKMVALESSEHEYETDASADQEHGWIDESASGLPVPA